ncbi:MAG: hypothetical protein WAN87_07695 [Thermoplasmata archaeon]
MNRRDGYMIIAILMVGIVLAGGVVYIALGSSVAPPAPVYPTLNATLSVNLTQPTSPISPNILGVNVRADSSMNGTQGSAVAGTSIRFVRWPGGALADRYDPFGPNGTATIYTDDGTFASAASTPNDFVTWCRSVHCSAIVTVPGEIDQPALAAQEVRYFETNLDFFPTYWEIGNEPGNWDHYAIPWSEWLPNQTAPPTPTQYAELVRAYISSMRAVDPTIPIIGLPGIGSSNTSESAWIKETVDVNGPNLSAVALHIYPAGAALANTSLAAFMASVTGPNGLASRVATARAAIQAACANCSIEVIADEIAAATGSDAPAFVSGFPLVPYEATEVIQGIAENVSALLFWVADSGYSGSWVTPNGSPRAIYSLFTNFLDPIPAYRLGSNVSENASGLSATAWSGATNSHEIDLLLSNANTVEAFRVTIPGLLPSPSQVATMGWNSSSSSPIETQHASGTLAALYLPPLSVVRVEIILPAGPAPQQLSPALGKWVPGPGPVSRAIGSPSAASDGVLALTIAASTILRRDRRTEVRIIPRSLRHFAVDRCTILESCPRVEMASPRGNPPRIGNFWHTY